MADIPNVISVSETSLVVCYDDDLRVVWFFDIKINLNIYTVSPPSFLNDSLKIKKLPHRVALSFIHGKATWIVFFGFSFEASCLPSWIVRVWVHESWIMSHKSFSADTITCFLSDKHIGTLFLDLSVTFIRIFSIIGILSVC